MAVIRAGVIGLGVGEQHALAYASQLGVELRAVADIDPIHLAGVADRLGVARRFTEWRKVTEDPEIDVVSICSWDDAHAEQAISAFENGKHVMVEKPLCLNRKDAERVLRAQQDSGKRITSNLILRRAPVFVCMRDHIRNGTLGAVMLIEAGYIHDIRWKFTHGWRSRMASTPMLSGAIHMIDLVRWMLAGEVLTVEGLTAANLLTFDVLVYAKIFATLEGPQAHFVKVCGNKRGLQYNAAARVSKGALIPDWIAAIRDNREPEVSARDVFRVMDICFACVEAMEQRKPVTVSYLI